MGIEYTREPDSDKVRCLNQSGGNRMHHDSGNASLHLGSIGRLALNISAFVTTCVVMALFVSLPLFLKDHIDNLQNTQEVLT